MIIDWIYGLVGGLFIGLGGLVLLIFNGRIMGASGILGQLIDGKQDTENLERIVFLIGVIAAPLIILQFSDFSTTNVTSNTIQLVLAGLLVGAGTRIANGCTSGHGGLRHIAFVVKGPARNCCLYCCRSPDNGNSEDFLGINMSRLLVSFIIGCSLVLAF